MVCLENAKGEEKNQVQLRCFETILTLLQHRSSFRNNHRPFENFEAIFKTLDALNPENPHTYYRYLNQDSETDKAATDKDAKHWLDMATNIDHAARDWINFALNQAVERVLDEKTRGWLEKAISVMPDDDLAVIVRLVPEESEVNDQDDIGKIKIDRIKKLEAKLEKLDAFIKLSELIREELIAEIQQMNTELHPHAEDKPI